MITFFGEKWKLHQILLTFVLSLLLIWYSRYRWSRRRLYKLSSKVPGPKGWPFVGVGLDFLGSPGATYDNLMNYLNMYPNLAKGWFGPFLLYAVSKPQYLEKVLTSPKALAKMDFYKFLVRLGGHGLITAPVPTWKRHRRIIMPTFNKKVLNSFVETFGKQSSRLCDDLEEYVGRDDFDAFGVVSRHIFHILCETTLNLRVNVQSDELMRCVERTLEIVFMRMARIWCHLNFIFEWTKLYQSECENVKKIDNFIDNVIREKQKSFQRNNAFAKHTALLDLLLEMSLNEDNRLTEDEMRDEIKTILIAGTDTTSLTVSFVFTMLGMHPEVQENVYEEVTSVLGQKEIEPEDLSLLVYTERVIKETLRIFPVAPLTLRNLEEDLSLEENLVLPKGCFLLISIITAHRNSEVWPNPLKFDPDRFLPEQTAKRHPYSYIPFSGGLRNCIGLRYAMMNAKTIVATAVRRFKFYTSYKNVEDIGLKTDMTLKPRDGFKLALQLRK